ncbi:MAG: T9SS C-terminal target domain-containing protein [Ignavibacteriae bacterium]|nr:MAG: T9SS C-terminal target domain-containing protein [Ignavibacteriota bacterium]
MLHSRQAGRITVLLSLIFLQAICLNAQPKVTRSDITIRQAGIVGSNTVRIKQDPVSGNLYILQNNGIIQRVNWSAGGSASLATAYQTSDHGLNAPLGMIFGNDGTMYLVGNDSTGQFGTATIVKGVPDGSGSEHRTWSIIAQTVAYPYGNIYNHRMNGIVLNKQGDSLYVNSGAATDHGEMHGGFREVGLTSIILKLPVNGHTIILQNDREWLRSNGFLFAEGIRNTFDLAYGPSGDLFGVENSDDRDDPEELNLLQQGHHYGFPWRIGGDNTPQQYNPYNPHTDPLLSTSAWGGGSLYTTYSNDPAYPSRPEGVTFTEPIPSIGPDADKFRDTTTGAVRDASALGLTVSTFTPHRSIDGIVFDNDSMLAGNLKGGAFVISFSNSRLITAMGDTSQDLVHVALTKQNGQYIAHVTKLISGLNSPLGIERAGNILYVVETGLQGNNISPKLWVITLPLDASTGVKDNGTLPSAFALHQNYPNPFNPVTTIRFSIGTNSHTSLRVFDVLGREVATIVSEELSAGEYSRQWNASDMPSGIYICRLSVVPAEGRNGQAQTYTESRKLVLLK